MLIKFYATKKDLITGLQKIESSSSLQYIRSGIYDTSEFEECRPLVDSHILKNSNSFLIKKVNQQIIPRLEKTGDGKQLYIVDQIGNPNTLIFVPSEYFQNQYFKCGCIRTDFKNNISRELFRFFSRTLKAGYTRINGYWIGPEALSIITTENGLIQLDEVRLREFKICQ
jgi:hypothetical protein